MTCVVWWPYLFEGCCQVARNESASGSIDGASPQIHSRSRNIGTAGSELDHLSLVDPDAICAVRGRRCECEKVLNRVVEAREIADGRDTAGRVLVEETCWHGRGAMRQDGDVIGEDGQIVDGLDCLGIASDIVHIDSACS